MKTNILLFIFLFLTGTLFAQVERPSRNGETGPGAGVDTTKNLINGFGINTLNFNQTADKTVSVDTGKIATLHDISTKVDYSDSSKTGSGSYVTKKYYTTNLPSVSGKVNTSDSNIMRGYITPKYLIDQSFITSNISSPINMSNNSIFDLDTLAFKDHGILIIKGTNAESANVQYGELEMHDYLTGIETNNLVLRTFDNNPGACIRLEVLDKDSHIGFNIGGDTASTVTVKEGADGNGYIEIRDSLYQATRAALGGQAIIKMDDSKFIINTSQDDIYLEPYTDIVVIDNQLSIPGLKTTTSSLRIGSYELQPYQMNNVFFTDNIYYLAGTGWKRRSAGFGTAFQMYNGGFRGFAFGNGAAGSTATTRLAICFDSTGNVGIRRQLMNTHSLEINNAAGNCLKLVYNDENSTAATNIKFDVSSGGNLTVTPSGGNISLVGAVNFRQGTIANNDETPTVAGYNVFLYNGTANGVTITDLDNPVAGNFYTLIGNSDVYTVTIADSGNFKLSGSSAVLGLNDVITLYCIADNNYIEISRSDN